jgi:hypothetical protein
LVDAKFNSAAHQVFADNPPAVELSENFVRFLLLGIVCIVAGQSIFCVALGLALGSGKQRRIGAWFATTALVAAWLTLFIVWPGIAWHGQQWRLSSQVERYAPVAESLRTTWPTEDGELPRLGTFMAYPQGQPRMLMLIAQSGDADAARCFSVERSPAGAIRFELAGSEAGAWLEWHPAGGQPASFTGGLEVPYELERSADLGDGWYATRYSRGRNGNELQR